MCLQEKGANNCLKLRRLDDCGIKYDSGVPGTPKTARVISCEKLTYHPPKIPPREIPRYPNKESLPNTVVVLS